MGKRVANSNRLAERSNVTYMQRLVKRAGTSSRRDVAEELNSMMTYTLQHLNGTVDAIATHYTKKEGTLKAKMFQAAARAMLAGKLRSDACDAGAAALVAFADAKKAKGGARRPKKSA